MYNTAMRARLSVMDQDNEQDFLLWIKTMCKNLLKKWKSKKGLASDKFYFRPYIKGNAEFCNTELSDEDDSDDDVACDEVLTTAKEQQGRLLFIHQTALAIEVAFSVWPGTRVLRCHLQNHQIFLASIFYCG